MKKPSFIIGKKQIILSCLTLMLAVAVYVNYAMTTSSDVVEPSETADLKGNVTYGDTEFVSAGTAENPTESASEENPSEEAETAGSEAAEETAAQESGSFDLSA